jgi:hypothetical protein
VDLSQTGIMEKVQAIIETMTERVTRKSAKIIHPRDSSRKEAELGINVPFTARHLDNFRVA